MKSYTFTLLPVLMIVLPAIPFACASAACFDESPMVAAGEEPIQALTPQPVSREDFRVLNSFLSSLQNNWTGSGQRTECNGTVEQPQPVSTRYNVNGEITFDSGSQLTIRLSMETGNVTFDDLSIYELSESMLMADSNNDGSITTQVRKVSASSAEIYFKGVITLANRSSKKTSGVRPMEHVYKLSRSGAQLEITREIYLSGILVQIDNWQLRKGR